MHARGARPSSPAAERRGSPVQPLSPHITSLRVLAASSNTPRTAGISWRQALNRAAAICGLPPCSSPASCRLGPTECLRDSFVSSPRVSQFSAVTTTMRAPLSLPADPRAHATRVSEPSCRRRRSRRASTHPHTFALRVRHWDRGFSRATLAKNSPGGEAGSCSGARSSTSTTSPPRLLVSSSAAIRSLRIVRDRLRLVGSISSRSSASFRHPCLTRAPNGVLLLLILHDDQLRRQSSSSPARLIGSSSSSRPRQLESSSALLLSVGRPASGRQAVLTVLRGVVSGIRAL